MKSERNGDQLLAMFLNCAVENNTSNWSYIAIASFKLLPFNGHLGAIEGHTTPYVFDVIGRCRGVYIIRCTDLFNNTKNYVKNDTISLKVEINVIDPNDESNSKLVFENIHTCVGGCSAKYRLTINNIANLKAIQSPSFVLRNKPWCLSVYKDQFGQLGIGLKSKSKLTKSSCEIKMSAKLISTKVGVKAIEGKTSWKVDNHMSLDIGRLALLDELLKPQNGFIQNNSILIEIELHIDNLVNGISSGKKRKMPKRSTGKHFKLECTIFLKDFGDQEVSFTPCGHMFCTKCIEDYVKVTCDGPVKLNEVKRAHLPV